ncbi:MAG: heparin lyase I family protein [Rhizobiaceae bacterium]
MPNPTDGWVHMRYQVKGDRAGNGIIRVWANDRLIVEVFGKIGNDVFHGPTQYFKFGHYRDTGDEFEWSKIYFDKFRRGQTRSNVD